MRPVILAFVLGTGVALVPATASAASRPSPPQPPLTSSFMWFQAAQAETSVLPVFAAGLAVRAAVAVRAARAARAVQKATAAAHTKAKFMRVATAKKIQEVRETAKTVAGKGKKWLKANWSTIAITAAAPCLATSAFMRQYKILKDGKITKREWSKFVAFGPRLVTATQTLQIVFPLEFDDSLDEEVVECAVGLAVERLFAPVSPR